jgi:hypothetical protein
VHWAGPSYFIAKPQDVERIRTRRGGMDGSTMEGMVPFLYPVGWISWKSSLGEAAVT